MKMGICKYHFIANDASRSLAMQLPHPSHASSLILKECFVRVFIHAKATIKDNVVFSRLSFLLLVVYCILTIGVQLVVVVVFFFFFFLFFRVFLLVLERNTNTSSTW